MNSTFKITAISVLLVAAIITLRLFIVKPSNNTNLIVPLAQDESTINVNEATNSISGPTIASTIVPQPTSILVPTLTPTPSPTPEDNTKYVDVYITYYGWPDNDPPGNKIAYPKNNNSKAKHDSAGGKGTYEDPVTFASDKDLFDVGTILYIPYIKKYVVMEDQCATCEENWEEGKKHIDIWMDSNDDNENKLYDCQEHWTRTKIKVETDPLKDREVTTVPLFDKDDVECLNSV